MFSSNCLLYQVITYTKQKYQTKHRLLSKYMLYEINNWMFTHCDNNHFNIYMDGNLHICIALMKINPTRNKMNLSRNDTILYEGLIIACRFCHFCHLFCQQGGQPRNLYYIIKDF